MNSYADGPSGPQRQIIDPDHMVDHECYLCGLKFQLPLGVAPSRSTRPCGWSH